MPCSLACGSHWHPELFCRCVLRGCRTVRGRSLRTFASSTAAATSQQRSLVVVESPAKAKKIQQYLGEGYTVLASYGHVRDLADKAGSVKPEEGFAMVWSVKSHAKGGLDVIRAEMKGSKPSKLILATDPDREGEAISWHVLEELQASDLLRGVETERITFVEVTKAALQAAIASPRQLATPLIEAYLARRALDYLLGFNLTPVLWRKLPAAKSAGRVQSVALRLVAERESSIQAFVPVDYWTVGATLQTASGNTFQATLTQLDGGKVGRQGFGSEAEAQEAAARITASSLAVASLSSKETSRNPSAPFTTSTLQQEASRRLGFGAATTMSAAQTLYEGGDNLGEGVITYMRTDGVQLSAEVVEAARKFIGDRYGGAFLPVQPRIYKSNAKNAQEAHEAIRPTDVTREPKQLAASESRLRRLYDLIWRRTLASQMASAQIRQVGVDVQDAGGTLTLRATGSRTEFAGYLAVYGMEADDVGDADVTFGSTAATASVITSLQEGEVLSAAAVDVARHATAPPPRFTEGSLVKTLEEIGIGRPSTYAPTLQLLQTRGYISKQGKSLTAAPLGRVLTAFLACYFPRYVDYGFTAEMEDLLDDISGGRAEWTGVLHDFWGPFTDTVQTAMGVPVTEVIDRLDALLEPMLFPASSATAASSSANGANASETSAADDAGAKSPSSDDPEGQHGSRTCPACGGRLGLKLSQRGGFIGCSSYPECSYNRPLDALLGDDGSGAASELFASGGNQLLGTDPESGAEVRLRMGPYGPYLQLAGDSDSGGKDRNVPLPPAAVFDITLEEALKVLHGQRIGSHPQDGQPITLETGKFGPYLKHGDMRASLPKSVLPDDLNVDLAVELLAKKAAANAKKQAEAEAKGLPWPPPKRGAAAKKAAGSSKKAVGSSKTAGSKAADRAGTKNGSSDSSSQASAAQNAAAATTQSGKATLAKRSKTSAKASAKGSRGSGSGGSSGSRKPPTKQPAATGASGNGTGSGGEVGSSKAPSAYQAFRKARWDAVKAEHSSLTGRELFAAVSKALGAQWKVLSREEQAAFAERQP